MQKVWSIQQQKLFTNNLIWPGEIGTNAFFLDRYVLSRIASLRAKRFQVFILANTNILVYVLDFRLSRREIIENEADDISSLPKGTTQGSDLKNPD